MTKTDRPAVGSSQLWSVTKKDLQENAPYARWQDGDGDIWMYSGTEFLWLSGGGTWLGGVSGNYDDLEHERWTRLDDTAEPLEFGDHKVTKITILRLERSADKVYFTFGDAPKSLPFYNDALSCRFDCAKGTAEAWLQETFNVLPSHPLLEIIKV